MGGASILVRRSLPWSSRSLRQCYESAAAAFGWSRRSADLPITLDQLLL
jgi:hypothetical protein